METEQKTNWRELDRYPAYIRKMHQSGLITTEEKQAMYNDIDIDAYHDAKERGDYKERQAQYEAEKAGWEELHGVYQDEQGEWVV